MSLVNNMLRDLDQRRKDSEGSGGTMRLMPASEYPKEARKSLLPLALVGLGLVVIALVYYWNDLTRSSVDQRLNIPIASSSAGLPSSDERLVQELEESINLAESAEAEAGEAREVAIEVATSSAETVVSEPLPADQIASISSDVEPSLGAETIAEVPAPSRPIAAPVEAPTQTERPTSIAGLNLGEDVQLESMKEAPRYSNEQLDTIAVQEALRLISAGNTEGAFDTLGQYIIENRNAHQSRETYAKLLMNQGRVVDAAALIDAGLDLAPNHSGFKKVKARLLMGSGNLSDAVDILISRAPDIEDDSEYHDLLASAQLSSRDFAGAVISYRGLVEHDQTQGKWWYGYAAANDQLGNTSIARQAYSRAMQFSNLSANLRRRSQERVGVLNP